MSNPRSGTIVVRQEAKKIMKKILVIDDVEEMRSTIAELLNLSGFSAVDASDGRAGIRLAQENSPDLILCDVKMPNLDGYETLSAIRRDVSTSKIPFIFITGDKHHSQNGSRLGADGCLTKPFTSSELMRIIRFSLGGDPEPKTI